MSTTKNAGMAGDGTSRRTSRACDRCRVKKAKCDGNLTCKTCHQSKSDCKYTARRGREARNYYWRMQSVTEEALQRLYWASRRRTGFPGTVCDESKGYVTTDEILRGLGLVVPDLDEPLSSQAARKPAQPLPETMRVPKSRDVQPISPPAEPVTPQQGDRKSAAQGQRSSFSTISSGEDPTTPEELDMCEQFSYVCSQIDGLLQSPWSRKHLDPQQTVPGRHDRGFNFYPDVDVLWDTTTPALPIPIKTFQDMRATMSDCYLPPWTGTLTNRS
ncbi:hypothetical protein ABEF93_007827 [Exophiala dermatitidis]